MSRFRVNVFVQQQQVGMVIRTIANEIPDLAKLGLPDTLKEIVMTKRGLVLVVGATGSGKSTSLAAMIDHRNRNSAGHIVTVEDPVEFVHQSHQSLITHREVGIDTHSWHNALKNTLRQAPDVILIGEIRDTETMEHAITFAETGHLCLGTLHSNSANQTLDRIINFFPELYNEGAISYDEAIRNADSANELRLNIKLKGRPQQAASLALEPEPSGETAAA